MRILPIAAVSLALIFSSLEHGNDSSEQVVGVSGAKCRGQCRPGQSSPHIEGGA